MVKKQKVGKPEHILHDDLEEIMIMGDMGVRATDEILDDLREKVKKNKIKEPAECKQ